MRPMTRGNYLTDMIHVCVLANVSGLRCGEDMLRANGRFPLSVMPCGETPSLCREGGFNRWTQ
jgi:hypothetical protein